MLTSITNQISTISRRGKNRKDLSEEVGTLHIHTPFKHCCLRCQNQLQLHYMTITLSLTLNNVSQPADGLRAYSGFLVKREYSHSPCILFYKIFLSSLSLASFFTSTTSNQMWLLINGRLEQKYYYALH